MNKRVGDSGAVANDGEKLREMQLNDRMLKARLARGFEHSEAHKITRSEARPKARVRARAGASRLMTARSTA